IRDIPEVVYHRREPEQKQGEEHQPDLRPDTDDDARARHEEPQPRDDRARPRHRNVLVRTVPANGRIVPEVIHPVVDEQRAEEQAAGQEEDLGHKPAPEIDLPSDETPDRWQMARVSRMRARLSTPAPVHDRLVPRAAPRWRRVRWRAWPAFDFGQANG